MKRFLTLLFAMVLSTVILTGCGDANNDGANNNQAEANTEEVNEETIQVVISKDEEAEILSEKEIEVEEGDILLDVLKENFDIEEEGGFINEIDSVGPEEGEEVSWAIIVNGELAEVGAAEFELSPGDKVSFDLQGWE